MTGLDEFPCRRSHSVGAGHVELDADLRYGSLCRPLVDAEAGVSSLGQWPDPKGLAAGDRFAVQVALSLAEQRQPQRVDVQIATVRRIGGDHGHRDRKSTRL